MADNRTDAPILDEDDQELDEFDPASLPLGTFAAFDVSDQPLWTDKEGEYQLTQDQKNAIKAMVQAAAQADSVPHRIEIQGAWWLELLDRGLQRLRSTANGAWEPFYGSRTASMGMYGAQQSGGYYDTNVIGEKNDTITSLLSCEIASSTFFPEKPGDPDDEVYAQQANCLKHFMAEENNYGELQAEVGRFACTDETSIAYTRPVADAQRWGYEDNAPDVVPETEDGEDPDAKNAAESKRPKIRTLTSVYGKLSRKVPLLAKSKDAWAYAMLAHEIDISIAKAKCPWVAKQITAGDLGIAELKLDRLARQSVQMSMQSQYATGDSLMRDVTETYVWFRPSFYMDDSCPKALRSWFWTNFPKGILVAYESGVLAWGRNESMDEVLTEFHARSGNGQNRRALTESFGGPQMRLNVLVDLRDEFCRKAIPRVGLDSNVWNVDAIRASSVRAGVYEPFIMPAGQRPATDTVLQLPMATGSPDITAFIEWISGPLAEQLTHAQQSVSGTSDPNDPMQTATEYNRKDKNAKASFGECWRNILRGFANINTQSAAWNARVQSPETKFDSNFSGMGRITAEIGKMKSGSGVARADGMSDSPTSWADREAAWGKVMSDPDPAMASIKSDPENMAAAKRFMPPGMVLPGVDSVEKQQAEFDILLKSAPKDNPQFIKIQQLVQQGNEAIQQAIAVGQEPDPQQMQSLQQGQQMMQQTPPMISSVPVRGDGSENDAVEALICLRMMNSAEGRRLASSKDPDDQARFQNLHLHWQQHQTSAAKMAAQNQQPIQPKTSLTVAVDKLDPQAQTSALQKMGVATTPEAIQQQNSLAPHEVTTTERGIGPTGSEIERKTSVVGKSLS
jgi:hypothetical protein